MKPNQNTSEEADLQLVKASEITPKSVEWLWYPYIPFGKVMLLQGDPGDGKSQLMLALSALASKGKSFPFADDEETREPKISLPGRNWIDFEAEIERALNQIESFYCNTLRSCNNEIPNLFDQPLYLLTS